VCLILLKISLGAKSQISQTDTLCFPVPVIQKVLIAANQKRMVDSLNVLLRSDINILTGKVNLLEEKDRNHLAIEKAYEGQIVVLNKEVRRWKNRTRLAAIGGLLLAGATAWVILK
jgi:type II secretory pathway component PulF